VALAISFIRIPMKICAVIAIASAVLAQGALPSHAQDETVRTIPIDLNTGDGIQDITNDLRPLELEGDGEDLSWRGITLEGGQLSTAALLVISPARTFGSGIFSYGRQFESPPVILRLTGAGGDAETLPMVVRYLNGNWIADLEISANTSISLAVGLPGRSGRLTAAVASQDGLAAHLAREARLRGITFGAALLLSAYLFAQTLLNRRGLYLSAFLVSISSALLISATAGWRIAWLPASDGNFDSAKGVALMLLLGFGIDFARRAMRLKELAPIPNRVGLLLSLLALMAAGASYAMPPVTSLTALFAILVVFATGVVVVEGTRQDVDGPKLILGPWMLFALAAFLATVLALIPGPRFGSDGTLLVQGIIVAGALATALSVGRLAAIARFESMAPAPEPVASGATELRLSQALAGARKGVWDWRIQGDRLFLSGGAMALLGFQSQGGEGKEEGFFARVHRDDQDAYRDKLRSEISRGAGFFSHEMRVMNEHGTYRWLRLDAEVKSGTAKNSVRVMGLLSDVTAEHAQASMGGSDPLNDALTGLAGRALFLDRLDQAEVHAREGEAPALIVMNVDRFQAVIDGVGHAGADTLLITLARRLEGVLPQTALPARLGADEFGVLVEEHASPGTIYDLCETIRDILSEPLEIDGEEIFPALSFGIAFAGKSGEGELPFLRRAEVAMYHAKRTGGARIESFRPEFARRKGELLSMETGLNRALERREIELLYQPILSIMDGRLVGFEALMRWNHPEHGQLSPDEFLDLAEETGAIVPLGRYVVEIAAAQLLTWQTVYRRDPPLYLSVNLSARQILHHDLTRDIERILAQSKPALRSLVVEVTESMVMENPELAERRLHALTSEGLGLALDDFGTGYSSLSHLARFSFNKLKIDREFVEAIANDDGVRIIVSAIIGLARDMGQEVIAEGVQEEDQLRLLKELGCDCAQGFMFGKPMTAADAERLIYQDQMARLESGEDVAEVEEPVLEDKDKDVDAAAEDGAPEGEKKEKQGEPGLRPD